MSAVQMDLRYAIRGLARSPGFALVAVLTLGLGLGASIAAFTIVNAVFFTTLPYRDAGELVMIEQKGDAADCQPLCFAEIAAGDLHDWEGRLRGVKGLAGLSPDGGVMMTPDGLEEEVWADVSANIFTVLGLEPLLGRVFTADDDRPGAPDVVVLSHDFWQRRLGGDPAAVGRVLTVKQRSYQIVGVMRPESAIGRPVFYSDTLTAPFFVPMGPLAARSSGFGFVTVLARLAPGARVASLIADLDVRLAQSRARDIAAGAKPRLQPKAKVTSLRDLHTGEYGGPFGIFLGTVLLVLLVACANLAGLFLARLHARRQEIAVRVALGAGRARLIGQLLAEGLLITAAAAGAGLLLAHWGVGLVRLLPVEALPYWTSIALDSRVLLFAAVLAALSGVIFGLGPAYLLTRPGRGLDLRTTGATPAGGPSITRSRAALVSAQIAASLVLLTGAGLLAKTFIDVATRDIGTTKHSVLSLSLETQGTGFGTPAETRTLMEALRERIRALPDAAVVGVATTPPDPPAKGMTREGDTEMTPAGVAPATANSVSPAYLEAMGYSVIRGRTFSDADDASSPAVVLIDTRTAVRLFPNQNAIGRRVKFGDASSTAPWMTIIGILAPARHLTLERTEYSPVMYRPMAQAFGARFNFTIRTRGDPNALRPPLRAIVRGLVPTALASMSTLDQYIEGLMAPIRLNALVLGALALFGLAISTLGVYGIIDHLVTQRTVEIGVRMALGASAGAVQRMMVRSVGTMMLWGVATGVAGSLALTRVLRALLYGSSPTDLRVFLVSAVALSASALLAAYWPARRAARVDPVVALRAW